MLFRCVSDTQCGFKGFNKNAGNLLFNHLYVKRFSFDVELFILAHKFDLSIKEVPVNWKNDFNSTVSFWKDTLNILYSIFAIKFKYAIIWPFKIKYKK